MRPLLLALGAAILLTILACHFIDDPVARFVHTLPWATNLRVPALGFPLLAIIASIVVLATWIQVATGRPLGRTTEIVVIAAFSLAWSITVTEFVLKRLFGRTTPDTFLQSGVDAFHWFQGTPMDSFPSGHAVQIVSVGAVFALAYPKQRMAWVALMAVGLLALVLGNWHFVSDVIAGTIVGTVGAVSTVLIWKVRPANRPDPKSDN